MRVVTLRYALAPACILLAALLYLSPAGPMLSATGVFVIAVLAAAWFGGTGPGFVAAILATLALPQLIAMTYPLLGGFLDLPHFLAFSIAGLAVGWESSRRRRVEQALRESEKRFRSLTELSNDFFWETDTEHRYTLLDFGLIHRGQHENSKKLGKRPWEIPHTSPDEAAWAAHRAAIDARKSFVDFTISRVDRGDERFYEVSGEPRFDADGTFLGYRGVGRETTARVRAEQAFRQSQESYALAMDATGAGHWDWKIQTDEFYASPRHLEIGGFAPDEKFASGAEFADRYPFHPEDRPKWQAAVDAHFADKTPRIDIEIRILPKGELRWVRMIAQLQRDHLGRPLRYAGVSIDTTEAKLAEQALRTSEDRFALAVAGSYDGVWDVDFVASTAFFSARTRELCGLPPGPEMVPLDGAAEALPLHPEDVPRRAAALQAHLSGTAPTYEGEFRLRQPDGVYRWRRIHGVCVRDAAGTPLRIAGSISDVDARRRGEDALRESEQRYERAMDSSEVGYWDWIPVVDKIYTSPRLLEIYGFAPGTTFAGRSDLLARIPWHTDDRAMLIRASAEHIAGKTARYKVETRFFRDGEARWVSLTGMVARDPSGELVRWTGTARDITERKRSELALRQSEERYQLAMAASESGYWDWDIPSGRYLVSPRAYELAGFPPETDWVTREDYRASINMHPEDLARWETGREALFAGTGERLAMEVRYMVKGEHRWHMLNAICKRDDTGKVVRWTGSATDITERKRAEEGLRTMERKLRQAQRLEAVGTLAGGIAHDFNNILGAILGYGEIALQEAPGGSRLERDLRKIVIAGERGRALVDRVLAFSRSAIGERVAVNVERVVREALDLIMAKLPPSVTVRPKLHGGSAAVLGDATQVHQVVANLSSNAVQAMPGGGTLRIELSVERVAAPRATMIGELAAGEHVVLTVADSGTGIPQEILDRIFDPFFTTKEVGTGTGLGLSLVHGIVTDLGGAIDVASTPGRGSTFTVYLPRCGDAAEAIEAKASALPRGDGERVLIVDDEESLVELAARTLEKLGYAPTGFTSSAAALAAFRADPERFDAVITDERMSGMSGSALIREVRGIRGRVPIVMMSGYIGGGLAERAREAGADEVLKKPLSAHDVATGLARVLQK